jgi:putative iron-regulated protein
MKMYKLLIYMFIFSFAFAGCNDSEQETLHRSEAVETYADIVLATYEDTYKSTLLMQDKINAFLLAPSEKGLSEAKNSWLVARESYGQTDAFRFYGGPIDDEDGPEGQMNAWPLDESYIDYVANSSGASTINIINSADEYPDISAEMIASLNENGSETNVSSGYHAIEFLLWGQDLSPGAGAGNRPYTDYVIGEGSTAENQKRRGTYLAQTTNLLLSDLSYLISEWKESESNFRAAFTASSEKSIIDIISGLGKLSKGELAGERMFVPLDLQSKEDEHSCFSDNTDRDIVNNALGIRNVFFGSYTRTNNSVVSGTSIYEIVAKENQELADEIKELINKSLNACELIKAPFDQEILNAEGRDIISNAIQLLRLQGDKLAQAAQVLTSEFEAEAT